MSQVSVKLGIADHVYVWQEKRAAIAATVDALGDRFKPELRTGWLAYIREFYSNGPVAPAATSWCLMIESLMLLVCMLTDPQWWLSQLVSFLQ